MKQDLVKEEQNFYYPYSSGFVDAYETWFFDFSLFNLHMLNAESVMQIHFQFAY